MPYKNKADRKSPKNPKVGTEGHRKRMERQRARRAMDKKGKDVSHNKALSKGGSNKEGVTVESKSANRSRNYKKKGSK